MSKPPVISVIMPVYNAGQYLKDAIDSILQQSFADFEFLIFNDGSTDESAQVIKSYNDNRIHFFDYSSNSGHVLHLNKGIQTAQGKYIARMDADDISHPLRFEKQVNFLERHKEVGVCGTWFSIIDDPTKFVAHPERDQDIRFLLLKETAFGHPTVMMRTDVLKRNNLWYKPDLVPAEDYQLWVELSQCSQLGNIPEILLYYRRHQTQISKSRYNEQVLKARKVRNGQLQKLIHDDLTKEDQEVWEALMYCYHLSDSQFLKKTAHCIHRALKANDQYSLYEPVHFLRMLNHHWKSLLIHSPHFDIQLLKAAYSTTTPKSINLLSFKQNLIFIIKCFLHWKQRND